MNAEEYMKQYEPNAYIRYLNYRRKDNIPKPGTIIKTMKGGFGSLYAGRKFVIYEINEQYIVLASPNWEDELDEWDIEAGINEPQDCYLSDINEWWEVLQILEEKN
jgi:hypothetical protein